MKPGPDIVRAYLLGQLPASERATLAEEFALGGDLELGESALVDDYAMGLLSDGDRRAFEEEFLVTDHRRESLAMAQGIVRMERVRRRRKWLITAGMATAGILLLAFLFMRDPADGTLVLALVPNSTRGVELPEFSLETESSTLVLELQTPEAPPACEATVSRVGEEQAFLRIRLLRTGRRIVRIAIDRSLIEPGDYHVKLSAGEEYQRDFEFRILR